MPDLVISPSLGITQLATQQLMERRDPGSWMAGYFDREGR
jgi:hypothetical protein